MFRRLVEALCLCIIAVPCVHAQADLNWFSANVGGISVYISPEPNGNSTAMLLFLPETITFSNIYFDVIADSDTTHFYDLAIGDCQQSNHDCSQPNQPITIVCSLGSSSQGINLPKSGAKSFPCAQGPGITIGPGIYVLLAVGNVTNAGAKCVGEVKSPVIPFASPAVIGDAINGSLTSSTFQTGAAGASEEKSVCMISLH